ncbi:MAG: hypothetical protein ACM3IJ_03715 [Candidatus Levyibacteriota bacterium]
MTELGHKGPGAVEGKIFKNKGFDTSEQGYRTSVGFFGASIIQDADGKTVFSEDSVKNRVDVALDRKVRSIDEHTANAGLFLRNAGRVWKNRMSGALEALRLKGSSHLEMDPETRQKWDDKKPGQKLAPRSFLNLAVEGTLLGNRAARYRGSPEEIAENAQRLGLSEYYGLHPLGVEFKKPEIYTKGTSLYDIIIAQKEGKTPLIDIDKNQALSETARYVRNTHDNYGAVGELLIMDIQFRQRDGNQVLDPVLGIPDIVWNKNATMSETAKKATDILDFMVNLSYWEHKAETDPVTIQKELDLFLETYGDDKVIRAVRSFINPDRKSKKPTLPGEHKRAMLHNVARLGASADFTPQVRQEVFDATVRYLHPQES